MGLLVPVPQIIGEDQDQKDGENQGLEVIKDQNQGNTEGLDQEAIEDQEII